MKRAPASGRRPELLGADEIAVVGIRDIEIATAELEMRVDPVSIEWQATSST